MTESLTELQLAALSEVQEHIKQKPITGKDLANKIGLKPRSTGKEGADMRSVIHALRVKGYPVCATGEGYWWPQTQTELDIYIESLEGRVRQQQEALYGLKQGADKVGLVMMSDKPFTAEEAKIVEKDMRAGGVMHVEKNETVVYYEVTNFDGSTKVVPVARWNVTEFLTHYPSAKKL